MLHPDERNVLSSVANIKLFTDLDPNFYSYGAFFPYLIRAYIQTCQSLFETGCTDYILVGRFLSAFFSATSVLLAYFFSRLLFGKKKPIHIAIFTLLTAISVGYIQYAHFAVTESMLIWYFFIISILSLKYHASQNNLYLFCTAIVIGVATATKTTAIIFSLIPAIYWLWSFGKRRNQRMLMEPLIVLSLVFTFFFVSSPYNLLNFEKFKLAMQYEEGVVKGTAKVPYTIQFNNTPAYLYQFGQMHWYLGPILPTLSIIALVYLGLVSYQKRRLVMANMWPFIIFGIVYAVYVGGWHTKFIRYLIPLLPIMHLLSAWFLGELWRKKFGRYLVLVILVITIGWTILFASIYFREHPRIEASKWIFQNVPARSTILTEHWDDGLPIHMRGTDITRYTIDDMELYQPDSITKTREIAEQLAGADYVAISSRRLIDSVGKDQELFPVFSNYYKLLFTGQLGYQQVASFHNYPRLFGLVINDDVSEESFQTYDHPSVWIFRNTQQKSAEDIYKIIYQGYNLKNNE